jgi:beta-lactamase regulating signal transducer with metallopeptidase domain
MDASQIDYLFKVALFLAAGYLFYYFLLRNDVHFLGNRLFLLFMLPLSFLLPLAPLQSPFRSLTVSPEVLAAVAAMPDVKTPQALSPVSFLVLLYWAVAAVLVLRILFHLYHLYRLQRRHPRERLRNVTLVKVASPIPPFSFFNRIFLHPAQGCSAGEMEQIISHESVHIRQLHSLDILLMELAVALQWFNPFIWLYRKALKETHEYLADREVIAQGFNADGYRLLLFEQQFGAKLFEFASHLKQSQIKRRMFMMNRMHKAGKAPYKIILALPLVALLALAMAQPRLVMARATATADKAEVAQSQEKTTLSEQELKDLQAKLEQKEKVLKEKLSSTTDPEEKEKLKQALDEVYKKRQYVLSEQGLAAKEEAKADAKMDKEKLKKLLANFSEKEQYLKQLYKDADTPEKKEKIKQDMEKFQQKFQEFLTQHNITLTKKPTREQMEKKLQSVQKMIQKLEQAIASEKDPDKLKELNQKFEKYNQFAEELKARLSEDSPQLP